MINLKNKYSEVINGEVDVIRDEIDSYNDSHYTNNLNVSLLLENIMPHLASIEHKLGRQSVDYINISTEIVDIISHRMQAYMNSSSDIITDKLSVQDIIKFYSSQKEILIGFLSVCQKLETLNMDYAYRIKKFNLFKKEIEDRCNEKGIDTRTAAQKGIDQLKEVGTITGIVAKETAGCALEIIIKVAIVIVVFLILMAIVGVGK